MMNLAYVTVKTWEEVKEKVPPTWSERIMEYVEDLHWPQKLSILELLAVIVIAYQLLKLLKFLMVGLKNKLYWAGSRFQSTPMMDFNEERMRPGSMLEAVKDSPKFQLEVYTRRVGGLFVKSGQAFNTDYGIFTAYHVVENADEVRLVGPLSSLDMPANKFQQLESDVALYKMQPIEATRLGIGKAKLHPIAVSQASGLVVKVQAFGQRTMGMVTPSEGFGLCHYTGSTIPGFSGAPYCVGNYVYGMHMAGTASNNLGFEAAYLYMLARKGNESTEDYLMDEIFSLGKKYSWQRSPYDPDEARIQVDGKYYVVDLDFARNLNADNRREYHEPDYDKEGLNVTQDEVDVEDLPVAPRGALQYQDSKNLMAPPAVAGGIGKVHLEAVARSRLSKTRTETGSSSQRRLESLGTDGLEETRVRQNNRLSSTSTSTRKRGNRRQLQSLRSRQQYLQRRIDRIERGE